MTDPALPPVPPPAASAALVAVPGKTLGIVGLIVDFFFPLVGLILSIVASSQSKRAGVQNTPAKVGIVLGIVFMVLYVIVAILIIVAVAAACTSGAASCTSATS